jgi:rfaE bifunctional protein kinase chain/domain
LTPEQILSAFPKTSALVLGDICLDRWCTYDPALAEPSRETGISRLAVVGTDVTPGAGGTVANNLAALGIGRVAVMGTIGTDGFGHELAEALSRRSISPELLIRSDELPTFTYTKLINAQTGIEDQPRVDFIFDRELPHQIERQLIDNLWEFSRAFDVLFVSDQAETERGGVITPGVRNAITAIAQQNPEKVILVDSRIRSYLFRNVIIKPNEQEAEDASARLFGEVDHQRLRETVGSKVLFVTQGMRGVLVVEPSGTTLVPAPSIPKPVDICGAGDSFSAGAGVALAVSGSAVKAAHFGSLVASVTIMKKGTGTASPEEVLAADKHAHAGH